MSKNQNITTKKQEKSIVQFMNQDITLENIQKTLGQKTPQFIASVASLVNSSDQLKKCDHHSIMSACLKAATLDLPIDQNLGFAYVIPYGDKAQFQMGWKGFVQLAMRSGQVKTINVTDVRESEIKNVDRLSGQIEFEWVEEGRDKLEVVGYVAYIELINGFKKSFYMTVGELKAHASKYSQAYRRDGKVNPWKDNLDAMASKTVVKLLLSKYAPMTIEMQTAILADQAVIDGDKYTYVDNADLSDLPTPDSKKKKDENDDDEEAVEEKDEKKSKPVKSGSSEKTAENVIENRKKLKKEKENG